MRCAASTGEVARALSVVQARRGSVTHMSETPARAAIVYHPLKTDVETLREAVLRCEATAGWQESRWYPTTEDDAGDGVAALAVQEGATVVLATGGDGTVRAVAEALRGGEVPLAVIPQGTGNLLARNLGMPLGDLDAAVQAAFFGEDRPIDLGVATITRANKEEEERVFLVLAGMGLDARMITATRSSLKKQVGWLAYVDAGMRSLLSDAPLHLHYSFDGSAPKPLEVFSVMIGNCGLLPGGVLLIPDARLDDGQLDVVALRPLGRFAWLKIWRKIGWENGLLRKSRAGRKVIDLLHDTDAVTYRRAKHFALSVPKAEPLQLDGDDFGEVLAMVGSVDPASLKVRVLPEWIQELG